MHYITHNYNYSLSQDIVHNDEGFVEWKIKTMEA